LTSKNLAIFKSLYTRNQYNINGYAEVDAAFGC